MILNPRYAQLGTQKNRQEVGVEGVLTTLGRPINVAQTTLPNVCVEHQLCGLDANSGQERQIAASRPAPLQAPRL